MRIDENIRALWRRVEADPKDKGLRQGYINALLRTFDESMLSLLGHHKTWSQSPVILQDAAIAAVSRRLGETFEHHLTKTFRSPKSSMRLGCFRHRSTGIRLSLVPGGAFHMGTSDFEAEYSFCEQYDVFFERDDIEDEAPRWVHVAPFLIGQSVVTERQWSGQGSAKPRHGLTWEQAQRWLSKIGLGLRMPSEVEWEYACRAGTHSRFYWGDEFDDSYCWHASNSQGFPHKAAEHLDKANAFGLIDMLGNVSEWCQDWHDSQQIFRCYRGGNWQDNPSTCRAAFRDGADPDLGDNSLGLRVVASIPGETIPEWHQDD